MRLIAQLMVVKQLFRSSVSFLPFRLRISCEIDVRLYTVFMKFKLRFMIIYTVSIKKIYRIKILVINNNIHVSILIFKYPCCSSTLLLLDYSLALSFDKVKYCLTDRNTVSISHSFSPSIHRHCM